jgi:hypothetical protein
MAYTPVISPTAERAIDAILERYRDPGILASLRTGIERLALDPVRQGDRSRTAHGRPWITVKHSGEHALLYFQVFYRIRSDESTLDILDVGALRL